MTTTTQDATEFGLHVRQGGWRLGLLVARNVERGKGGPRTVATTTVKVTAREFAEMSDTSADRVLRHLDAWNRAADTGHVPPSTDLTPGSEVDLEADNLPAWSNFYDGSESRKRPSIPGTTPEELSAILPDNLKIAIAREVMANPDLHDLARDELNKATEERHTARATRIYTNHPRTVTYDDIDDDTPEVPTTTNLDADDIVPPTGVLGLFLAGASTLTSALIVMEEQGIRLADLRRHGDIDQLISRTLEVEKAAGMFREAFMDAKTRLVVDSLPGGDE